MSDPALERTPMTKDAERVSDIVASEVVSALRSAAKPTFEKSGHSVIHSSWLTSAADIIEAQSKALAEAREALQPFADAAADLPEHIHDMVPVVLTTDTEDNPADIVHIGDFRRALAALTPTPENPNGRSDKCRGIG